MGLKGLSLRINRFGKTRWFQENPKDTPKTLKVSQKISYSDFFEKTISQSPNIETLTLLNAQKAKTTFEKLVFNLRKLMKQFKNSRKNGNHRTKDAKIKSS